MRKRICLAAIVVITIAGLFLWTYAPAYGEICSPNEYDKHKECANYHMLLVALWHVGKFLNDWGIALTAIFTALIAYFTLGLFLDGKTSSRSELRAYLGIVHGRVEPSDVPNDPGTIYAWIDIKNTGETPAKEVTAWINAATLGLSPSEDEFTKVSDDGKGWAMVPQANWALHRYIHDPQEGAVDKGEKRIWVWGEITYTTVFEEKCTVKFRYYCGRLRYWDMKSGHPWRPLIPDAKGYKADYGK